MGRDSGGWPEGVRIPSGGNLSSGICKGSTVAVLATGFFSGKSCWGPLPGRPLGAAVAPTAWPILAISILLDRKIGILPGSQAPLYLSAWCFWAG